MLTRLPRFGSFLIAVGCTWTTLTATAFYYSRLHPDFHWIWSAAFPSLLIETLFYLGSVVENVRLAWAAGLPSLKTQAAVLWISALLPYLVFSLSAGTFAAKAFYLLAGLSGVFVFWYVFLPRRPAYDFGFLVIAAVPFITRIFGRLYLSPDSHLRVDFLGHLMWIRLGVIILLIFRGWDAGPVGLWPRPSEWKSGVVWFMAAILPVTAVAFVLGSVHYAPADGPWWRFLGLAARNFYRGLCRTHFRGRVTVSWSYPTGGAALFGFNNCRGCDFGTALRNRSSLVPALPQLAVGNRRGGTGSLLRAIVRADGFCSSFDGDPFAHDRHVADAISVGGLFLKLRESPFGRQGGVASGVFL